MVEIKKIITYSLILIGIVLITIGFVMIVNSRSSSKKTVTIDENTTLYIGDSNAFESDEYIPPILHQGRYYLNGNKDNYYFEVRTTDKENTIELCCDNKYSLFQKWNPDNDTMTKQLVDFWSRPQKFDIMVLSGVHKTFLAVDMPISVDDSKVEYVKTGPILLDERTLSGWGIEGDFVRLDD